VTYLNGEHRESKLVFVFVSMARLMVFVMSQVELNYIYLDLSSVTVVKNHEGESEKAEN
jgi:hypothetical protein